MSLIFILFLNLKQTIGIGGLLMIKTKEGLHPDIILITIKYKIKDHNQQM